jgi:hypothetical protein
MTPEDADAHLATWPQSIPDSWHPVRVQSSVESYDGCDVYPDLIIMGHYNSWRCRRIKLGFAVQEMVDGICASVPFMIGDRKGPAALGEPGAKYPHLEGSPTSEAHYRAASAKGGWYLIGPLMLINGVESAAEGRSKRLVMETDGEVAEDIRYQVQVRFGLWTKC